MQKIKVKFQRQISRCGKELGGQNTAGRILRTALLLLFLLFSSNHQLAAQSASLEFDSVVVNNHSDCDFVVELTDTTILSFEVGLGSTRNTTDVLLLEIDFDNATNLPSGISYTRSGPLITLNIGSRPRLDYYYGQVRVKNAQGQWGAYYRFIQN
jgi:hypothetical protein